MLRILRLFLVSFLFASAGAMAAGHAYDQAHFDALQKEGKPTLVVIHADWCPICKAQGPVVNEVLQMPEMKALTMLQVDFDKQKNALKGLKATMQSTLIVFKGGKEVGRSTGETRKDQIVALLRQAL